MDDYTDFENEQHVFDDSRSASRKDLDESIAQSFFEMGEEIGHDKALKLLAEILYD